MRKQAENMKNEQLKHVLPVLCMLLLIQLAGCTSSEEFYQEAGLSRDSAYRQWKSQREVQEQSQTRINGQLSLQDCLKLTIVNNKALQRVAQEKEFARGNELKSYSAILPSANLTGDYTRLDEVQSIAGFTIGDVDNYSAGLMVTQPVFAGGSIIANINAGKLFSLLTDQTVRATTQDVIYEAEQSYYDVLLNQHLYQISADAVRSSQAHLDDVEFKRSGGVASDFDVLRAQVELSNFQAELIKNKNAINVSKAQLLKVMGISQDSNFILLDELIYVPLKITMEQAVETAYHNRPDLYKRQFDIKYQKELLNIARSRYWPTISGFYDNSWAKPDPHNSTMIEWGSAWQAGVMATLPVFDGFSREGDIIQQKARFKQSQIDLIDAEETTLFELTKGLLSIEDAEEFVQSQQLNLTRAEEGSRLAQVGYREGINTQVEVIDAESALTEAKSFYYQAIYSHIIAKLYLQKAMGILTTFEAGRAENQVNPSETLSKETSTTFIDEKQEQTR
ncbi:MAG: TolC family protein [Phycisphaerae bacterium]|nr:TolC family protein [Phycisphaerae bacterium]MDD5381188.1 TolC family protein [Phycisphaerae bacterium]